MKNTHLGSSVEDFLDGESLLVETEAAAIKRVVVYQIEMERKKAKLTKSAMAEKMHTSRFALGSTLRLSWHNKIEASK